MSHSTQTTAHSIDRLVAVTVDGSHETCGCDHVPFGKPKPLSIVDDPAGGLDPLLVVQSSRCCTADLAQPFVELIGELDTYTASSISADLTGAFDNEYGVVLDVFGVSFLDGAGLRFLERFGNGSVGRPGRVWLHDPSRSVQRLIAVSGFDTLDVCAPANDRTRSLRYERSPGSERRIWQWDEPRTTSVPTNIDATTTVATHRSVSMKNIRERSGARDHRW